MSKQGPFGNNHPRFDSSNKRQKIAEPDSQQNHSYLPDAPPVLNLFAYSSILNVDTQTTETHLSVPAKAPSLAELLQNRNALLKLTVKEFLKIISTDYIITCELLSSQKLLDEHLIFFGQQNIHYALFIIEDATTDKINSLKCKSLPLKKLFAKDYYEIALDLYMSALNYLSNPQHYQYTTEEAQQWKDIFAHACTSNVKIAKIALKNYPVLLDGLALANMGCASEEVATIILNSSHLRVKLEPYHFALLANTYPILAKFIEDPVKGADSVNPYWFANLNIQQTREELAQIKKTRFDMQFAQTRNESTLKLTIKKMLDHHHPYLQDIIDVITANRLPNQETQSHMNPKKGQDDTMDIDTAKAKRKFCQII